MARFVMRVWLADSPGALGALTTRLGDAGIDLIGIEILEREADRVVDELTVSMPDDGLTADDLAHVVSGLDIAQVEDIRSVVDRLPYPGTDPLAVAVELGQARTLTALTKLLAHGVAAVFAGDWAAVLGPDEDVEPALLAAAGQPPASAWLAAFVSGASASASSQRATIDEPRGPRDVAWAVLECTGASVVVGRGGPPFRGKERIRLVQLCQIADAWWRELSIRAGMAAHPSAGHSEWPRPAAAS